jgi:acyl-CoA thioesterase-1
MAIGDSITQAEGSRSSYRRPLDHLLVDGGYDVDLVGRVTGAFQESGGFTDYDQDHEGQWGRRTDEILAQAGEILTAAVPDVALVHLGTNDVLQGQSVESTVAELDALVGALRAANPSVTVLLAQILPTASQGEAIPSLNAAIAELASVRSTAGSPVVAVDQHTGFSPATDTYDGIHPNEAGEQKVAARWFDALVTVLGPPSTPPDTTAPTVAVTSPADGTTVGRRAVVDVRVEATDDRAVARVEIRVDGALACAPTQAPYTCSFVAAARRGHTHRIDVTALDARGNATTVTVRVVTG